MAMDGDETPATQSPVCYRHSDRTTRLACSECGKPICADCSHDSAVGQRCHECARPKGRNRIVDARRTTGALAGFTNAPVSLGILILTIGVFLAGLVSIDFREWLTENLASFNLLIADGEYWRLVSSALVHSYFGTWLLLHIGFNMYFLYRLGPALERQVGSAAFLALYLATDATASLAGYLLGDAFFASIGASGAIFGLVGVWIYALYKSGNRVARALAKEQLTWLVLIGIVLPFAASGLNISWQGHLGGLLGGFLIGWGWGETAPRSTRPKVVRTIVASAVLVAVFAVVAVLPTPFPLP